MQQSRTISHKYFTFDIFYLEMQKGPLANKYKQQSLTFFQAFFSGHSETRGGRPETSNYNQIQITNVE